MKDACKHEWGNEEVDWQRTFSRVYHYVEISVLFCFPFQQILPDFPNSRMCSISLQELHIKNKHIACSHIHIYIQWWCPHEYKVGSTLMYDIYIYYKPIQINGLTKMSSDFSSLWCSAEVVGNPLRVGNLCSRWPYWLVACFPSHLQCVYYHL